MADRKRKELERNGEEKEKKKLKVDGDEKKKKDEVIHISDSDEEEEDKTIELGEEKEEITARGYVMIQLINEDAGVDMFYIPRRRFTKIDRMAIQKIQLEGYVESAGTWFYEHFAKRTAGLSFEYEEYDSLYEDEFGILPPESDDYDWLEYKDNIEVFCEKRMPTRKNPAVNFDIYEMYFIYIYG